MSLLQVMVTKTCSFQNTPILSSKTREEHKNNGQCRMITWIKLNDFHLECIDLRKH